ncbi:MAG: hypothetical protein COY42_21815 [Armatimonadetes bacterium CG_4_10_14_0_8_um_filter_66_14]|nr:MAG: hypothetical protein AUJ96_21740 [Armatimonadetes bacterium CG2_30_66_41]PIU94122.1 MAG: hypothetical protein COS65_09255 [Armatimonadetes bacterium CG06_land_8_20_14_3_00_66_21]PIX40758.1 MAG: hypothetical protein COZ57_25080 [Armatimonadetes bacterium CG_4_8_14_3_um_filter_66_20]PIZ40067.1 MAG: hypothetical protein COY42_21815 [Armatimonadetes bacterium CG_4_10_14_0_8_um_filter_66_14]PJB63745.1 MAG: hypothetical protein CO096_21225 [Armatimonadetes bacterium CG_4_9_14_3_um_filter_66_1
MCRCGYAFVAELDEPRNSDVAAGVPTTKLTAPWQPSHDEWEFIVLRTECPVIQRVDPCGACTWKRDLNRGYSNEGVCRHDLRAFAAHYWTDGRYEPHRRRIASMWKQSHSRTLRECCARWGAHARDVFAESIRAAWAGDPEYRDRLARRDETALYCWELRSSDLGDFARALAGVYDFPTHHSVKRCLGCGRLFADCQFDPISVAEKVGFRTDFCNLCLHRALYSGRVGRRMKEETLFGVVQDLAEAFGCAPPANFRVVAPRWMEGATRPQINAIILALRNMPDVGKWVPDRFDSWLHLLIAAGVLECDVRRGAYGTQCLADDGHACGSLAEKAIDDWLSSNGVRHEKEPHYPPHSELNPHGKLRADWLVGEIFVEYFGLPSRPDYARKMQRKTQLAGTLGIHLLPLVVDDLAQIDQVLAPLRGVCRSPERVA